jgi:hypothetical protein
LASSGQCGGRQAWGDCRAEFTVNAQSKIAQGGNARCAISLRIRRSLMCGYRRSEAICDTPAIF